MQHAFAMYASKTRGGGLDPNQQTRRRVGGIAGMFLRGLKPQGRGRGKGRGECAWCGGETNQGNIGLNLSISW